MSCTYHHHPFNWAFVGMSFLWLAFNLMVDNCH